VLALGMYACLAMLHFDVLGVGKVDVDGLASWC